VIRITLSLLCTAVIVTGCLFPSFDAMQNEGRQGGIAAKGESDVTEANETTPSTASTTDASPPIDAASSSSVPSATITCEADAGVCAANGSSFCCATIGGPKCQGPGTEGFCTGVEGGRILRCDDNDDCPGNANICCWIAGAKEAACAKSCAGAVLCNKDDPKCPAGQSCTGVITHGGGFTSSSCQ
jgi:hypothetical protein